MVQRNLEAFAEQAEEIEGIQKADVERYPEHDRVDDAVHVTAIDFPGELFELANSYDIDTFSYIMGFNTDGSSAIAFR